MKVLSQHKLAFCVRVFRARFLSLAQSKLRLCSANHRPGYWSGPRSKQLFAFTMLYLRESQGRNGIYAYHIHSTACAGIKCKVIWRCVNRIVCAGAWNIVLFWLSKYISQTRAKLTRILTPLDNTWCLNTLRRRQNILIRTLHDCPSQMNENLLISNSKLTSDSELICWR